MERQEMAQHPQRHYLSPMAELYLDLIEGRITRSVYDRRRAEIEGMRLSPPPCNAGAGENLAPVFLPEVA